MGNRILEFGFNDLGLHRIIVHCYTENYGSYRVIERIDMRREGCFLEARPANKFQIKSMAMNTHTLFLEMNGKSYRKSLIIIHYRLFLK
ncbi:MAG TPA: GNAT family protein [Clostridiales bacterium]|nr:GNAT family protein [Clostridiales bacterium]